MKYYLLLLSLFYSLAYAGPVIHWIDPPSNAQPMMRGEPEPYPLPEVTPKLGAAPQSKAVQVVGPPGSIRGQPPQADYSGLLAEPVTHGEGGPLADPFFTGPTSDEPSQYAPFQRWTWYGRYLTYPTSTIGKLFFRQDRNGNGSAGSFVCSAAVISENVIATAAHCLNNGRGGGLNQGWSFDILFCPSFNLRNGVNPQRGCWAAEMTVVASMWADMGLISRDYGCALIEADGGVNGRPVGLETGWLGRAWNWPSRQPIHAWGYPAGNPFNGMNIIVSTSTEWYERDLESRDDHQVSKYIGSDMTGGSSGGPWWMNTTHPRNDLEQPDIDGSNITDPDQGEDSPILNGVNSHRLNGLTQEMGSPQFLNTADDDEESEDVFRACLEG